MTEPITVERSVQIQEDVFRKSGWLYDTFDIFSVVRLIQNSNKTTAVAVYGQPVVERISAELLPEEMPAGSDR